MIDIHCHLLPGIDDGPETLKQALELAQLAVDNGITHSVVTPHIHPGRWENSREIIQKHWAAFKQAIAEAGIPLQLGFASEVRLSPEILQMVAQDQIPFLGEVDGYKILLLELPHSHVPPGSDNLTRWLLDRKIRPMIAHPERNKGIMRDVEKIQPFVDQGCFFQLTAGAAAGLFGEPAQNTAKVLLERGCVTIIASDAHNVKHRPPRLDHGRDAAAAIIGDEQAEALVNSAPMDIVGEQFATQASDS
jgi:protein-tyrosine phosphatase